jgi:acyl dehydratase
VGTPTALAASVPVDLAARRSVTQQMWWTPTRPATHSDHNDPSGQRQESPFGGPVLRGFLLLSLLTRLSSG